MKNISTKHFLRINAPVLILLLFVSFLLYGFATGIDGLTLKTSTNGCSCHSPTASTSVIVFLTGPDSVVIGTTVNYTVEISEANKTGAGVDIAARIGSLGVVTPSLHLSNGELVHNSNITMTNHAVVLTFSYTAPGTLTTDTIFATGLATNSNNQSNGDIWNWATNKRIIVRSPLGITPISGQIPSDYTLAQNYPNPFNPSTNISFSLPKSSFTKLEVIDLGGKVVDNLVNETLEAGAYRINWNAGSLASGIYFYKIEADGFSESRKMILVK